MISDDTSPLSIILATTGIFLGCILIKPIIWPVIVTFPWKYDGKKEETTVVLAGSYNPPHLGHLAMLEHLSKRYQRVVAVVGFNPNKTYPVSPQERVDLLKEIVKTKPEMKNVEVRVVEGYIWRWAKKEGTAIFLRGIRSWEKDGGDERSLQILNTWGPLLLGPFVWPIPTVYLEGNPKYNHVSSTLIRDLCSGGSKEDKDALAELVPESVTELIAKLYGAKDK